MILDGCPGGDKVFRGDLLVDLSLMLDDMMELLEGKLLNVGGFEDFSFHAFFLLIIFIFYHFTSKLSLSYEAITFRKINWHYFNSKFRFINE